MSRPLPHLERELLARLPRWWPWLVTQGVQFANHGPRWVPLFVRMVPLNLALLVASFYAREVCQ